MIKQDLECKNYLFINYNNKYIFYLLLILGSKMSKKENLKEMGDVSSGMASTVIQLYLKGILNSFLHTSVQVRQAVLKVIQLILAQGLVHPVQVLKLIVYLHV